MALVPVRSKQPVDGEHFVTEVSEEWLSRWPEDFDRLEGEELVRYELKKAGVGADQLDEAVAGALALSTAGEATAESAEIAGSEHVDDALEATVAAEPGVIEPTVIEPVVAPDATA